MAKPAYVQLLLCLVLTRHTYTQDWLNHRSVLDEVQSSPPSRLPPTFIFKPPPLIFQKAPPAGPDSYYVQIFPSNPTTGPPLKLAEVQLMALSGGHVPTNELTYTFTTGAPPQPVPSDNNNAACSDGDVEGAACAGDPKQPSTLTITFPSIFMVQVVVVQNADTGACTECDITFYRLKVVHAVGNEKVLDFGANKRMKTFVFECLDLVSLNIQPRDSSMGTAAPLVVNEIQLLSPNESAIARNLLKYTVLSIPKDNATQPYFCEDYIGCYDGNFQTTCGACNTGATNFTITYPTWVNVSEVQVSYSPCGGVGCKNSITDYVLRFIDQNQTATSVGTAFTRPPVNGSMFSIQSTEWLEQTYPPKVPSSPERPLPPPLPSPKRPGGSGNNIGLIVGASVGGVALIGIVVAAIFLIIRHQRTGYWFGGKVQEAPQPHPTSPGTNPYPAEEVSAAATANSNLPFLGIEVKK